MQNKKQLIMLFLLAVVAILGINLITNQQAVAPVDDSPTPTQTNSASEATTVSYQGVEGATVLDLLLTNYPDTEVKDSSFGQYVDTLNGIAGGTDNKYWLFYVNDEPATVGAAEYITHDGDKVEWRFE